MAEFTENELKIASLKLTGIYSLREYVRRIKRDGWSPQKFKRLLTAVSDYRRKQSSD